MKSEPIEIANRRAFQVIALVYFSVFLAHNGWRATLQNHAVDNLGFDGRELGLLFAVGYIPGILTFTLGFASTRLLLRHLLLIACLCLALGLLLAGIATDTATLLAAGLLIALGFTGFQALAVASQLTTSVSDPSAHLGSLRSLGPLAGLAAGVILLAIFTPVPWSELLSSSVNGDHLGNFWQWFSTSRTNPEAIRSLFVGAGLLLIGTALAKLPRLSASSAMSSHGNLRLQRALLPYYLLNGIAGCRSAVFQVFALHIMIRQYQLPIHGTAALMMAGYCCSFLGYRAIGHLLRHYRHRNLLSALYILVALNFSLFWAVTKQLAEPSALATGALGTLFLVDSLLFGASVITDSHLLRSSRVNNFVGDVGCGATVFYSAAMLMSLAGSALWQPLENHGLLLGTLVCLIGAFVSRYLID